MTADCVGGVWTYALELSRALGRHNIEVDLAVMGQRLTAAQQAEARAISNLNLFKSEFKLEWMNQPWRDVQRAGDWLIHLERGLSPDLIHLNNFAHASLPWNKPKLVVAHSCVFSWWQAVHRELPPSEWNEYHAQVTRGLQSSDLVVAPTAVMLNSLKVNYRVAMTTQVIPNGVSRWEEKRPSKRDYILTAGRLWDEAKNVRSLMKVARELSWPVFVAGSFESNNGYNVAQFKNTFHLGQLSQREVRRWLNGAAIYCSPAYYEPFGLSILEAATSGCALVLGDIPSLREVWGNAAVYVRPDDGDALRDALARLINENDSRKEMAHRAYLRSQEYTADRMAKNYVDCYTKLISDRSASKRQRSMEMVKCA